MLADVVSVAHGNCIGIVVGLGDFDGDEDHNNDEDDKNEGEDDNGDDDEVYFR